MTKEKYLEMKKQARVWFTVNIIISLIAITGGILVIISKSRHIPFLLMSLGAITLMNQVLITPAFNAKKAAEEQHPEWKEFSTKGTKIPVEDFQKGFLISVAALLIVITGFFMFYRPLPKADPTVSNLTPKAVQILQELEEDIDSNIPSDSNLLDIDKAKDLAEKAQKENWLKRDEEEVFLGNLDVASLCERL